MKNKTEILQHVLKIPLTSLFPIHIKWFSGVFFSPYLCLFQKSASVHDYTVPRTSGLVWTFIFKHSEEYATRS